MKHYVGIAVFCLALAALPAHMGFDCDKELPRVLCDEEPGCAYHEMYLLCGNPLLEAKKRRLNIVGLEIALIEYYRRELRNVGCFPKRASDPETEQER